MSVNERVRLAQELHDGIAQDLVGLGYAIDSIVAAPHTPNDIRAELRTLRFAMSSLVDKVRAEIFSLRTSTDTLLSRYENSTNFELQKVFAELLRNVHEHSQATLLTITVHDNGVGGVDCEAQLIMNQRPSHRFLFLFLLFSSFSSILTSLFFLIYY